MAYVNVRILRRLKEELAWAIDKQPWLIIKTMLFKAVIPLNLKNKAILNLKHYCMCCYVTFSNVF